MYLTRGSCTLEIKNYTARLSVCYADMRHRGGIFPEGLDMGDNHVLLQFQRYKWAARRAPDETT